MRHIIVSFLVVTSLLSVSCTSKLPSFRPYKMDIQQGNVVTSKMMLQLRPGMTKSQVRFIMGTPLIQDSFHSNRWDYFYQMRKDGKIIEQRRVILDFEKEALLRVRGDVIPAGTGDAAAEPTTGTEPVSQPEDKKSLMEKLKFWKSDKKEPAPEPQAAPTELVNPAASEAAPASVEAVPAAEPESPEPAVKNQVAPAPAAQPALVPEPAGSVPAVQPSEPAKAKEPVAAPAAKPEPVAEPAPQPAPAPVVEPEVKPAIVEPAKKPAEKAAKKPATEQPVRKAEPAAEKEPPREDEPGYFEYMLEKIGF